ncbi:hypothetical protein H6G89_07355 [Oscillatoria sp. FACHB-1407]|uniref:hypothetical protein n=1 Tax=Oscillatoria sp. FACHB-1407 TaxID=2692847 RepID=UPI001685C658|nr:hypothetical protein [Oscillatoria sp. FACHB-1407]MBD2460858.1 hypothetical protein [Oscillatoria sp. FACHB-1407]
MGRQHRWLMWGWSAIAVALLYTVPGAIAAEVVAEATLPPPDDLPEEVARTQIILEGRSPVDGRPLTAAEYAELQAQLEARDRAPLLRREIRQVIFLLQFRRGIYDLLPFLPE